MSSIYQTDVLIVGGGPSGSSAALSMLKYSNLKVTIIEQNDLHTVRVGDHVHASLFDLLHYLGVEKNDFDKDVFLPGYSNLAAWGSDNLASRESIFSTHVDGYHLNRE
ncbi:MAG: tryptophan 7-halogenase, partial [Winogradskyella sp.]|nr:tryptophan 7-halogenase [Winogradskyella sp.]